MSRRKAQLEAFWGPFGFDAPFRADDRKKRRAEVEKKMKGMLMGSYQEGTLGQVAGYLSDAPYKLRYGMGALDKDTATAMGKAPGYEAPQAASQDWTGARRAMSGYLAGDKWGEFLPNRFQDMRDTAKFYSALLTGQQPIGYSEPGEEAPGIDMRLYEIQRRATRRGAGEE